MRINILRRKRRRRRRDTKSRILRRRRIEKEDRRRYIKQPNELNSFDRISVAIPKLLFILV